MSVTPITTANVTHVIDPEDRLREDDMLMFHVMHQAMRSQSRALVYALEHFGPEDRRGAEQLRDWYRQMLSTIEHHHTVEDTIFFPMLVEHAPEAAALRDRMEADHHVLDERLADVSEALDAMVVAASGVVANAEAPEGWAESVRGDAILAAQALVDCLDDHLEREESTTFPVFFASVPHSAMEAGHAKAMEDGDKALMAFVIAWGLPSTTPAQERQVMAMFPRIVRALVRFVWVPRYEKAYPRIVAAQRRVMDEMVEVPVLRAAA
jgi:iron-sulfur cluster repair protein YtfE (RIC family)